MPDLARTKKAADDLRDWFEARGAVPIETSYLQPADTLLDLYGEDIRARAYTVHDPLRGELMLRPDFTVPVVEWHMKEGAEPARYTYAGPVFRRQEIDESRPNEYLQVGFELFGEDEANADATVFGEFAAALADLKVRAVTGDIGILAAAVAGLNTTDRRKAALMRHIWRPRRFRQLLDRFGGRLPVPSVRVNLLTKTDPMADAHPLIGLRSADEIAERIDALHKDAAAPALSVTEMGLLDDLLNIREKCPEALSHLSDLAVDMPEILPAIDRLSARLDALDDIGVDVDDLDFEAAYGRSSMEYYDGFVFGFYAADEPDLPPVATGGRYNALTRQLGQGRAIPAVGGVIRPALLVALSEGQA